VETVAEVGDLGVHRQDLALGVGGIELGAEDHLLDDVGGGALKSTAPGSWGSTGGCIGLLTACLSEVGCTELHLAQESVCTTPGAVSRSRAWGPFA